MKTGKDNPFAEFERLTTEIEEMFFRFYGGPRLRMMRGGTFQPLADVYFVKDTQQVIVKLEIPGISPDEVHLTLQDKTLIIEGNRSDPHHDGEKVYQQMEIDYGEFKRKIMLPVSVDVNNSRAEYQDGFLTIELPLSTESMSAIRVPINEKGKE